MTVEKPCANMKRSCKLKAVISFIFASRMCSNQRVFPNKKKTNAETTQNVILRHHALVKLNICVISITIDRLPTGCAFGSRENILMLINVWYLYIVFFAKHTIWRQKLDATFVSENLQRSRILKMILRE